jgi:tetratricopeptide (TPR) repeat protein
MRLLNKAPAALVVAVVSLFASQAAAQSELENMSFEELIGEAKTAYEAEKFDDAIKFLLAANRAQPNARLLLNVAKSYEKSGQCVKAMVYFRAFVRDPDAEVPLADQARASMEGARKKCEGWNDLMSGRLQISANQPGASATIDGTSIGTLPTEVTGLMEGDHTIVVTLEGYDPYEETLKLYPDKDAMLKASLKEKVEEVVVEELPPPKVPEEEPVPIVQYAIAGGVGAVGLGLFTVGLITDLGIPGKYDEPREVAGIQQSEFDSLTDDRKSAVTRATIFYILGGVFIAGGAGYGGYVAATHTKKETAPRLTVAPDFGRDGVGISLSGTF